MRRSYNTCVAWLERAMSSCRIDERESKMLVALNLQRRRKMFLIRGAEIMASEASQKKFAN